MVDWLNNHPPLRLSNNPACLNIVNLYIIPHKRPNWCDYVRTVIGNCIGNEYCAIHQGVLRLTFDGMIRICIQCLRLILLTFLLRSCCIFSISFTPGRLYSRLMGLLIPQIGRTHARPRGWRHDLRRLYCRRLYS